MAEMTPRLVCHEEDIPMLGARVLATVFGPIAIFRTAPGEVFAVDDRCPHKGGPLSQGIVHGRTVTCPLHAWKINLELGEAMAPDVGCTHRYVARVEDGQVFLELPGA